MTVFQAAVLGIIQGLTEFLPISSSAHLTLAPWLFGWRDPGLAFDVALHLGSLAAVLWYFRVEWKRLIAAAGALLKRRTIETAEDRRILFLVAATVPALVGGVLLRSFAETAFRNIALIGGTLIVLGILLWAADRFRPRHRELADMRWRDAWTIGIAQVAALVPGVSRSGATITAARFLGLTRESAAVFSFLLSMPVTAAAIVFEAPTALRQSEDIAVLAVGVVAAAVSSWAAITVLLRYVSRHSYRVFAAYRVALGVLIFTLLVARG